jgi:hypothetical protein
MSYSCEICMYKTSILGNLKTHFKSKKHRQCSIQKDSQTVNNVALCSINATSINNRCSKNAILYSNNATSCSINATLMPERIEDDDKNINKPEIKINKIINLESKFICNNCNKYFVHSSSLYRHKKTCQVINNNLYNKIHILESEKIKLEYEKEKILIENKILKKIEKEKSDLLTNFMSNASTIINKAQDNTKLTTEIIKNVSMCAIKFANDKYSNAPILQPIENFNINNLNFNNEKDRNQLIEILLYHAKLKSLDKLLGEHIIKVYKKENPEIQSIHTTDSSRLNYIVKELIKTANNGESVWEIDKNGIKICSKIIKPLIDKCVELLLIRQQELLNEMYLGHYQYKNDVNTIINVIMSIDKGGLEMDINKFIAPYFNLIKQNV